MTFEAGIESSIDKTEIVEYDINFIRILDGIPLIPKYIKYIASEICRKRIKRIKHTWRTFDIRNEKQAVLKKLCK